MNNLIPNESEVKKMTNDRSGKKDTEPATTQTRYVLIVTDIIAVFRKHNLTFEQYEIVLEELNNALQYLKIKNPI